MLKDSDGELTNSLIRNMHEHQVLVKYQKHHMRKRLVMEGTEAANSVGMSEIAALTVIKRQVIVSALYTCMNIIVTSHTVMKEPMIVKLQ